MANPIEQVAAKAAGTAKAVKAGFNGLRGVFLHLAEEHGEVGSLMKRVSKSTDAVVRRDHYPQIRNELLAHERGELASVYSALNDYETLRSIVLEHQAEAKQLETAIAAVDSQDYDTLAWGNAFERLFALVQQHVEEEEKDFFPLAQKTIGNEETEALLKRYEAAKQSAKPRIVPV